MSYYATALALAVSLATGVVAQSGAAEAGQKFRLPAGSVSPPPSVKNPVTVARPHRWDARPNISGAPGGVAVIKR